MNKKILMLLVTVLAVAMLAVPVMAKPTKGNKVEVTLTWSALVKETLDEFVSGPVTHRVLTVTWNVTLTITDGPIYEGTVVAERKAVFVPQENGQNVVFRDDYVFSFPGGGFEGKALIVLRGFTGPPPPLWDKSKSYALFKGTGAFEGQTLNFGATWRAFMGGIPTWTGHWLKP